MAGAIFSCINCCTTLCNRRKRSSFFTPSSPTSAHRRQPHNPPFSTVNNINDTREEDRNLASTTESSYSFARLKIENERRVRQLAERGVMDVPHGVLQEVGTPDVAPRYYDVMLGDTGMARYTWEQEDRTGVGNLRGSREVDRFDEVAVNPLDAVNDEARGANSNTNGDIILLEPVHLGIGNKAGENPGAMWYRYTYLKYMDISSGFLVDPLFTVLATSSDTLKRENT
ncbi:hypothetical protein BDZ91DRAFT_762732 [Kalaharituber pfeilii]|nr:hypothetical protein BDZ91DRAFT_762732 [Kalaharituber pfeilii]